MGKVIVCEIKSAKKPFCIPITGQNIYSYEELCYYICQYPALFQEDFVTEEWILWLKEEIEAVGLAQKLLELKKEKVQGRSFVLAILGAYSYTNAKKIKDVIEQLDRLCSREEWVQKKYYADALYQVGCFKKAKKIYDCLIHEIPNIEENSKWLTAVYHARGCCFAKDMQYDEAAKSFQKALELGGEDRTREQYWNVLYVSNHQEEIKEDIAKAQLPIERYSEFIEAMERKKEQKTRWKEYQMLERAIQLKEEGHEIEYDRKIRKLITKWKQEYREEMR